MEPTPSIVMPGDWIVMLRLLLQALVVFGLAQSAWWSSARLLLPNDRAERSLVALVIGLALATIIPTIWGLLGLLSAYSMGFSALLVWASAYRWARPASLLQASERDADSPRPISLVLQIAAVLVLSVYFLPLLRSILEVPVRWDSLTYHLFLPAQWIQSATIENPAFPYPLSFVAHYPKHQELLLSSLMVVARNDLFAELGSLLLYPALGLAVRCLCVRLGASREAGFAAGLFVITIPAHFIPAAGAYAEGFLGVALISSLVFALAAIEPRSSESRRIEGFILCGLAIGLAAGTKYTALELGLLLVAMLGWGAWRLGVRGRELVRLLFAFLGVSVLSGGVWYGLNFAAHGNPFYPVPIGPLPGAHYLGLDWEGASILDRLGPLVRDGSLYAAWFSFSEERPWLPLIGFKLLPVLFLALYGAIALMRRRTSGATWMVLAFAILGLGYLRLPFWNVGWLPTQTRFAVPALCVGAALGFAALSMRGVSARILALLVVGGFVLDGPVLDLTTPDLAWDSSSGGFMVAGDSVTDRLWFGRLIAGIVFLGGVVLCLWRSQSIPLRRWAGPRLAWTLASLAVLMALLAVPFVREPLRYEQTERVGMPGPKKRFSDGADWLESHLPAVPAAVVSSGNLEFLYLFSGRSLNRRILDGRSRGRNSRDWRDHLEANRSEILIALRWPGFAQPSEMEIARGAGWPELYGDGWVTVFRVPRSEETRAVIP